MNITLWCNRVNTILSEYIQYMVDCCILLVRVYDPGRNTKPKENVSRLCKLAKSCRPNDFYPCNWTQ